MKSKLLSYASDLASFNGAAKGGVVIKASQISEKLLIIATEQGAATAQQIAALSEFMVDAGAKGVRVVVTEIP